MWTLQGVRIRALGALAMTTPLCGHPICVYTYVYMYMHQKLTGTLLPCGCKSKGSWLLRWGFALGSRSHWDKFERHS